MLAFDSENCNAAATSAPAKLPHSLPVQPVMLSDSKTNVSAARRPRNRCTRVVNIVNVNDSAKLPPTEAMDCAAGDQSSTPTDPRSTKRSQPLENVNDHRQSPQNESRSPNRHRDPPVIDKGLRLPQFNGTEWPSFIEEFEACDIINGPTRSKQFGYARH